LFLTGCRPTFHRCVLPPLSGRWSSHLWNVGRHPIKNTAVHPRRFWDSYLPPWELEISQIPDDVLMLFVINIFKSKINSQSNTGTVGIHGPKRQVPRTFYLQREQCIKSKTSPSITGAIVANDTRRFIDNFNMKNVSLNF
jgi:hypothetical protein